jgi:hypothetical protein
MLGEQADPLHAGPGVGPAAVGEHADEARAAGLVIPSRSQTSAIASPANAVPPPVVMPGTSCSGPGPSASSSAPLPNIGNRATGELLTASASPRYLQRLTEDELRERGTAIAARIAEAPQSSGFLWHLTEKTSNTNLYLLGTVHARVLASLVKKKGLVDFLVDTTFDQVYAELDQPNLALDATTIRADIDTLATPAATARERIDHKMATRRLEEAGQLDELHTGLAAKGRPIRGLETNAIRAQIRAQYAAAAGPNV